ncbi:MBL fold metallo-hydrolase [Pedobacter punctiformis]|uniref:MBL fold metallo-hydrolase n=1 Tax=Pedobacter punctiformis TaxID=3004097 RepID=A0ABT4L553_9SPHI|nr:MBL fold metallo-hydrolase [Pedobacter sp. HCMS5-2]MCZ4243035.1 MBL fold metallo-hydrolase [Pedobacter sp. HCMS5-2]
MKRSFKILKRIGLVLLCLVALLAMATFLYLKQAQFGQAPSGDRLAKIEKSIHYKNGKFHNLIETPTLSKGYSIWGETYNTLFKSHPRRTPIDSLPSIKTNLKTLSPDTNVVVWFGHSSVFIQLNKKRFLIDPVFSGQASPLPGSVKAYKGSDIYTADDMPEIDYLLISHDHYDHLDYETIVALKDKVKFVVCGLGVGAHFERWGYLPKQLLEKDWNEKIAIEKDFVLFTETSHHESGRSFTQGQTLWMSYLIQSPDLKIYISGDGGYDNRFIEIGKKYGGIDWAIMECGQYDKAWQSVHNLPEEVVKASLDLKAKNVIPVHHSKFTLGKHPWDEPLIRITKLSVHQPYRLATPMIGESVLLNKSNQQFKQWWVNIN